MSSNLPSLVRISPVTSSIPRRWLLFWATIYSFILWFLTPSIPVGSSPNIWLGNKTGTTFSTNISLTNTTTLIKTEIIYIVDTVTRAVSQSYDIVGITGFIETSRDFAKNISFTSKFMRFFIIMVLVAGSLVATRTTGTDEMPLFVIPVYAVLAFINFLPWSQAAALSVLAVIFYIGGKRWN